MSSVFDRRGNESSSEWLLLQDLRHLHEPHHPRPRAPALPDCAQHQRLPPAEEDDPGVRGGHPEALCPAAGGDAGKSQLPHRNR